MDVTKLLDNPNEKVISILGEQYIANILKGDNSHPVFILTNEKLYVHGTIYEDLGNRLGTSISTGQKAIGINKILTTSFERAYDKKYIKGIGMSVLLGIIMMIAATLFTIIEGHSSGGSVFGPIVFVVAILMFLSIVVELFLFITITISCISIKYVGGNIGAPSLYYTQNDISLFIQSVYSSIK
jgi:hypothetical protein